MKYLILLCCTLFLVNSVYSLASGVNVLLGDHPYHVSLNRLTVKANPGDTTQYPTVKAKNDYATTALVLVNNVPRGGTIVNANHVVTACSIVLNSNNELLAVNQFMIRAGSITFAEGFSTPVVAVFPHPEFNPWTHNNDVAVLRTTNNFPFNANLPVPNIAPAMLNERVISDGSNCVVVGFNNPVAGVAPLQQLTQPILNRDTACNIATVHNGRVLETMFCAGGVGAGSGICPSTIGGGIYCFNNFTGIASSGDGCGVINSPGIYTQVRHHIQWINAQLTRTQIPQAGPTHPPGVSAGIVSTVTNLLLICLAFLSTKL